VVSCARGGIGWSPWELLIAIQSWNAHLVRLGLFTENERRSLRQGSDFSILRHSILVPNAEL
jgi:hypothetical protein